MNPENNQSHRYGRMANLYPSLIGTCISTFFVSSLIIGCAGSGPPSPKEIRRMGESTIVSCDKTAASNAIVAWAAALTNGYVLYDNNLARRQQMLLSDDKSTVFMLKHPDFINPWGPSACLPTNNPLYFGYIIIRIASVEGGCKLAAAIHAKHFVRGFEWNVHSFGLDSEVVKDLPACTNDEIQLVREIEKRIIYGQSRTSNIPSTAQRPK